jgi:hypothetical protein
MFSAFFKKSLIFFQTGNVSEAMGGIWIHLKAGFNESYSVGIAGT